MRRKLSQYLIGTIASSFGLFPQYSSYFRSKSFAKREAPQGFPLIRWKKEYFCHCQRQLYTIHMSRPWVLGRRTSYANNKRRGSNNKSWKKARGRKKREKEKASSGLKWSPKKKCDIINSVSYSVHVQRRKAFRPKRVSRGKFIGFASRRSPQIKTPKASASETAKE